MWRRTAVPRPDVSLMMFGVHSGAGKIRGGVFERVHTEDILFPWVSFGR